MHYAMDGSGFTIVGETPCADPHAGCCGGWGLDTPGYPIGLGRSIFRDAVTLQLCGVKKLARRIKQSFLDLQAPCRLETVPRASPEVKAQE